MARVLCIHGIAQELKSRESLLAEWAPSLAGGVSNAGGHLDQNDVDMVFYGGLFRLPGLTKSAGDLPDFVAGDLDDPLEQALLAVIASRRAGATMLRKVIEEGDAILANANTGEPSISLGVNLSDVMRSPF